MIRKLIHYLPTMLRGYAEFQAICRAAQAEFETAWSAADTILNDQFISTAGLEGLARLEKVLGISAKGTDSIDDRRFRILTRINEALPYTLHQLREILEALCGEGNASAEIEENTYQLNVKIGLAAKGQFKSVAALLDRVVPQNLSVNLWQMYNTHADLEPFTHIRLAERSHNQLRNEVQTVWRI